MRHCIPKNDTIYRPLSCDFSKPKHLNPKLKKMNMFGFYGLEMFLLRVLIRTQREVSIPTSLPWIQPGILPSPADGEGDLLAAAQPGPACPSGTGASSPPATDRPRLWSRLADQATSQPGKLFAVSLASSLLMHGTHSLFSIFLRKKLLKV